MSVGHHIWHERFGLTCCQRCGIVKRRHGENKPCPGPVGVTLRAQDPLPTEPRKDRL